MQWRLICSNASTAKPLNGVPSNCSVMVNSRSLSTIRLMNKPLKTSLLKKVLNSCNKKLAKLNKNIHNTTTMKNMTNVYVHSDNTRAVVTRFGVTRSMRFLHSKFGGKKLATKKATEYAHYLKHEANDYQFVNAIRSVGRPSKTEFFGRRIIKN